MNDTEKIKHHWFFRKSPGSASHKTTSSRDSNREYLSSVFFDAQTLLCADGHGTLYALTLSSTNSTELLGLYELPSSLRHSGSSPAPFQLHNTSFVDGQAIAVLSFKCFDEAPPAISSTRKTSSAEFDVIAVEWHLTVWVHHLRVQDRLLCAAELETNRVPLLGTT